MMGYVVRIQRTRECRTAVVRAATTRHEFPSLWPRLLDAVWAFLRPRPGLRGDGRNVMLYRHHVPGAELAVEVGVQVTAAFEAAGQVVPSTLPATEAAVTRHTGSPAEIASAYGAIQEWVAANGRTLGDLRWEIYGDPDPGTGHFDVEVHWELA
jgi:effector-binding domain-containing protein